MPMDIHIYFEGDEVTISDFSVDMIEMALILTDVEQTKGAIRECRQSASGFANT